VFNAVVLNQSTKAIALFDRSNEANSISQREWLFGCFFLVFNAVVLNQSTKAIASFDRSNKANSISHHEWLFGCFFVAL
jgi:hypothetical protein